MKKIIAISDMHGTLPNIPKCDILLIGGDICPATNHNVEFQRKWIDKYFREWLEEIPAKHVVGIAGNHDFIFEMATVKKEIYMEYANRYVHIPKDLRWTYLQDSFARVDEINIWGSPWQLPFFNWAFNAPNENPEEFLDTIYNNIPKNTDIVICHGPPFGYGDLLPSKKGDKNLGSKALLKSIERISPKIVVCGHIHEGYGIFSFNNTKIINASILDGKYVFTNPPIILEAIIKDNILEIK